MDRDQGKDSKPEISAKLRKYIRLQIVGMSFVLAWPVAWILAEMYGLQSIVPIMSILMVGLGVLIFAVGHTGRQELKER